ncbi:uncharacterized protein LOC120589584 [Pteropus medius]|uniref:uncharacterized protein LOC120589584 n=1 Tax=Pteropus vampyrus TaxID=132908 RepID=UPI00196B08D8|nr:uncharacterized protein LOC120589584 [Pteropus giganteus]
MAGKGAQCFTLCSAYVFCLQRQPRLCLQQRAKCACRPSLRGNVLAAQDVFAPNVRQTPGRPLVETQTHLGWSVVASEKPTGPRVWQSGTCFPWQRRAPSSGGRGAGSPHLCRTGRGLRRWCCSLLGFAFVRGWWAPPLSPSAWFCESFCSLTAATDRWGSRLRLRVFRTLRARAPASSLQTPRAAEAAPARAVTAREAGGSRAVLCDLSPARGCRQLARRNS